MCSPPSNKMIASATVTTRSTVAPGSAVADGHSCAATVAQTRKNAGAGICVKALSRLDSTAMIPTRPITRTTRPNASVAVIGGSSPRAGNDHTSRTLPLGRGRGECGEVEVGCRHDHAADVELVRQHAELAHDVRDALDPDLVDADRVGVEGHDRRDA